MIEALQGNTTYDFLNGARAPDVVADVLASTVEELRRMYGKHPAKWQMPVAPRPYETRNFLGVPQTTERNGVQAAIEQNRGTENNMMLMKDGRITAYESISPGQSGFISPSGEKSVHYSDQMDLYNSFGKKRMWFTTEEVKANKRSEIRLRIQSVD